MHRSWIALALLLAGVPAGAAEVELDLTAEGQVQPVLLLPPVYKHVSSQGAFAGVNTTKVTDKHDFNALKKLIAGLEKQLGPNKVLGYDTTLQATPSLKPGTPPNSVSNIAQAAERAKAAWVVFFELEKSTLQAAIYDAKGTSAGTPIEVPNAATYNAAAIEKMSVELKKQLIELSKPPPPPPVVAQPAVPIVEPPVDDANQELERELAAEAARKAARVARKSEERVVLAFAAGAALRNQSVGGDATADLAELQSNGALALGFYAAVTPLRFFESTADGALNDLAVDVNYRRSLARARVITDDQSTPCPVTDDDLQVRGTYRYKLGAREGYLPAIGISAGYSQERATFGCNLPVLSALYRGIDTQLRIRQRVWKELVRLDLAFGPRFLIGGPNAENPGFSFAGEAWLELKPFDPLYVRGGAKFFRAQLSGTAAGGQVASNDLRAFVAVQAGVFF